MPFGTEVGLGPAHVYTAFDGQLPPKGHSSPHFSAHVYCGQTARWIGIPLGMEVGLGPGDIVLNGESSTKRGTAAPPPLIGPCLLWPNGRPSQQLLSSCLFIVMSENF